MPGKSARACVRILLTVLCSASLMPGAAGAQADNPRFVTAYVGQGVDSNLLDLLPDAVQGELDFDDTYLYAVGCFLPHPTPRMLQKAFDFLFVPNTKLGFEAVAGKHHGLQHNWEMDLAWQFRFAPWQVGFLSVRPSVGLGVSYALGNPAYEDGPKDNPEKRYRFQNFNTYELEWSLPGKTALALVTRIHHRSGLYGLIAPRRVGSNFLTAGLRYSF